MPIKLKCNFSESESYESVRPNLELKSSESSKSSRFNSTFGHLLLFFFNICILLNRLEDNSFLLFSKQN